MKRKDFFTQTRTALWNSLQLDMGMTPGVDDDFKLESDKLTYVWLLFVMAPLCLETMPVGRPVSGKQQLEGAAASMP